MRSASGTRKFFNGVAGVFKQKKASKSKVCLAARAERRLKISLVSSHTRSGRVSMNESFMAEKKSLLKETMAKFKGAAVHYEFGASTIMTALGLFAIITTLMYLANFNQVATKGYELKRLEAHHQQLLTQYEIKNMRLAEAMSLARISESERVSAMRRPSNVTYLLESTVLASK